MRTSIVFIHIPRSAGTALRSILYANYDNCIHIDGLKGLKSLAMIPEHELRSLSLVEGHINFDVSNVLPQEHDYITMLRSPVERVISTFRYICQYPQHRLHKYITENNISIIEYIESKCNKVGVDNGMTRILSGEPLMSDNISFGGCTKEMLEQARYNLEHRIKVFGIMERFEESVTVMGNCLNWANRVTTKVNETRAEDKIATNELYELIVKYNQLDIDLYNFAVELYTSKHLPLLN